MSNGNDYAMRLTLDLPYERAVETVTAALKEQGFGVLTQIDVRATLKEKLDVDFRKYAILGACNPPLAHQALTNVEDAGLLLPCNVIVQEETGGRSRVAILDPRAQLRVAGNDALVPVAREAHTRLEKVAAALRGSP